MKSKRNDTTSITESSLVIHEGTVYLLASLNDDVGVCICLENQPEYNFSVGLTHSINRKLLKPYTGSITLSN